MSDRKVDFDARERATRPSRNVHIMRSAETRNTRKRAGARTGWKRGEGSRGSQARSGGALPFSPPTLAALPGCVARRRESSPPCLDARACCSRRSQPWPQTDAAPTTPSTTTTTTRSAQTRHGSRGNGPSLSRGCANPMTARARRLASRRLHSTCCARSQPGSSRPCRRLCSACVARRLMCGRWVVMQMMMMVVRKPWVRSTT
eukprot:1453645-Rhodomonas_salina.3